MTTEPMNPQDDEEPQDAAPPNPGRGGQSDMDAATTDAAEAPPLTPEQEASMLRAALAEANEEIARQMDAVQRGRADLANARRRHDDERLNIQQQANSRFLVQLLPIVDELDLAVDHMESNGQVPAEDGPSESWVEGVRLIQRKLTGFLESQGVVRIEALGQPFNPEVHEAVGIANVDGAESGSIVEVLRQGYRLHDRVVQAAQVVVNQ